jgi:hypothetical protein
MLHAFLTTNRSELIDRCKQKVSRRSPAPNREVDHGIPQFLDQLTQTLYSDKMSDTADSLKVSGSPDGENSSTSEISVTAGKHGKELLAQGFSVGQVVHAYGDLCQSVTELAAEKHATISVGDFRTLNRCLDNAIAQAVTSYVGQWNNEAPDPPSPSLDRQLASLGNELSNALNSIILALDLIRQGTVGFGGATGSVLNSKLASMSHLIDSLAQIRLQIDRPTRPR